MNAAIPETIGAAILGLGMQISEIRAQRKFVSAMCHAHSNARQNCGSYSFDARIKILTQYWGFYNFDAIIKIVTEMYCSHQYLSVLFSSIPIGIVLKKKFETPTLTSTSRPNL